MLGHFMPWRFTDLWPNRRVHLGTTAMPQDSDTTRRWPEHNAKPVCVNFSSTAGKCAPMQVFQPEQGRVSLATAQSWTSSWCRAFQNRFVSGPAKATVYYCKHIVGFTDCWARNIMYFLKTIKINSNVIQEIFCSPSF